jgi:rhamnopyranosyl-N-acetylglucosaminyl-diphospho-decaprenol beta-1,3/1,4-galactofuranosyltransferase
MKRNLPMYDICAIVVTYNRKELLCECLDALLAQTYPPQRIYVIDNNSGDGTYALLDQKGHLTNPCIDYEKLPENIGGAGGFSHGLQKAHRAGHDFYYLLDDDAEPKNDAIEKLAAFLNKGYGAYASAVYSNYELKETNYRGNFDFCDFYPVLHKALRLEEYAKESVSIDMASFVGFLISHHAVTQIGFPKTEFFIHYDDTEYCIRLSKVSKILMIPASVIYHKEKRQEEKITKCFLWFCKNRIRYDKLWIKYFGRRNSVYLACRHSTCKARLYLTLLLEYLVLVKDICFYDDNKINRLKFATASYLDGIAGMFDNQKSKKIL